MVNLHWTQRYPPAATVTENSLPDLSGKTFVVTGANGSSLGHHLALMLHRGGGHVYLAGRSEPSYRDAMEAIEAANESHKSHGSLTYLPVDLSDLTSVASAAARFNAAERTLDVLFNNAGVAGHPLHPRSKQDYDMHLATNVLAPFLLARLLNPALKAAKGRVIWTASLLVDTFAAPGGLDLERDFKHTPESPTTNYVNSKIAAWYLASEMTRRPDGQDLVSLAVNPGTLWTGTWRWQPWWVKMLVYPLTHHAKYGAYTNLWAGLADIPSDKNGSYVIPWGRFHESPRQDMLPALTSKSEGGTGVAADLWDWCEREVKPFI